MRNSKNQTYAFEVSTVSQQFETFGCVCVGGGGGGGSGFLIRKKISRRFQGFLEFNKDAESKTFSEAVAKRVPCGLNATAAKGLS